MREQSQNENKKSEKKKQHTKIDEDNTKYRPDDLWSACCTEVKKGILILVFFSISLIIFLFHLFSRSFHLRFFLFDAEIEFSTMNSKTEVFKTNRKDHSKCNER